MVKYIDAEKFIAYLNKKMQSYKSKMVDPRKYPIDHIDLMALLAREYQAIIANIITLQQEQPEVDLEKEVGRFWDSCIKHKNERGGNVIWSNKLEVEVLARHFFAMGLNAGKEE